LLLPSPVLNLSCFTSLLAWRFRERGEMEAAAKKLGGQSPVAGKSKAKKATKA
jgi:hypothetical protein